MPSNYIREHIMTLPRIQAVRFSKILSSGRNRPVLLSCLTESGQQEDYAVKLYPKIQYGAVREIICSILATKLKLPVPQCAIVELDPAWAMRIPELAELLQNDRGPHFGTKYISGGFRLFDSSTSISKIDLSLAFDIFAWDMLIQNYDRSRSNPNLLVNGNNFVLYDHELAVAFDLVLGPAPPPWELRNQLAFEHVFYRALKSKVEQDSFDGFVQRLAQLTGEDFRCIADSIPPEWPNRAISPKILEHFAKVWDNLDLFRKGLVEALI